MRNHQLKLQAIKLLSMEVSGYVYTLLNYLIGFIICNVLSTEGNYKEPIRICYCSLAEICFILIINVDIFLERPGDGENFVYSPVDVNTTFLCAVNNTHILWVVNTLAFDSPTNTRTLHSREIFQAEAVTSSDGVTRSSVTVFGNLAVNNNSRICCQSQFEYNKFATQCTTLVLYSKLLNLIKLMYILRGKKFLGGVITIIIQQVVLHHLKKYV